MFQVEGDLVGSERNGMPRTAATDALSIDEDRMTEVFGKIVRRPACHLTFLDGAGLEEVPCLTHMHQLPVDTVDSPHFLGGVSDGFAIVDNLFSAAPFLVGVGHVPEFTLVLEELVGVVVVTKPLAVEHAVVVSLFQRPGGVPDTMARLLDVM